MAAVLEQDAQLSISEGWKISLLRKLLPDYLGKEISMRISEFGDDYEKFALSL